MEKASNLVGWVALCLVSGIGGRTLSALLEVFGSPNAVFEASTAELKAINRMSNKTIEAIQASDLNAVQQQIEAWQAAGMTLLTWQDPAYPTPFLSLSDRPPLLFARGKIWQSWERVVAIVGTREPDVTSHHLAQEMGRELTRRGWLVVSGLARGIDSAAHRGALQAGATVAMVGCGVDELFPVQNRSLGKRIMEQGVVYAEVPPSTPPSAATLMARNRLIAGAAKATLVIQAGLGSGSLEAARRARQGGRHVFTVDHEAYEGNQTLLRMEAYPLEPDFSAWDDLSDALHRLPDPPKQLELFEEGD